MRLRGHLCQIDFEFRSSRTGRDRERHAALVRSKPHYALRRDPASIFSTAPIASCSYVGKAKHLNRRVLQHFKGGVVPRPSRQQVAAAATEWLCWIETESELHALVLEDSLIKGYSPIANKQLKKWRLNRYICIGESSHHLIRSVGIDEAVLHRYRSRFGPYPNRFVAEKLLALGAHYFGISKLVSGESGSIYGEIWAERDCDVAGFEGFLSAESDEIVDLIRAEIDVLASSHRYEEAATARERLEYAIAHLGRARFAHQFVYRNLIIHDDTREGRCWIFTHGSIDPSFTHRSPDDDYTRHAERSNCKGRNEPIDWALVDRAEIVRRYVTRSKDRYRYSFY